MRMSFPFLCGAKIPVYTLEKSLKDCTRAVKVRRFIISRAHLPPRILPTCWKLQNHHTKITLGSMFWELVARMSLALCQLESPPPLVIDGKSYFTPLPWQQLKESSSSASRGNRHWSTCIIWLRIYYIEVAEQRARKCLDKGSKPYID